MKTKTTITELSHDDLVNLFSTALTGSSYLVADYDESIEHDEDDCYEDIIANILLHGGIIQVTDYYAEGEVYGGHEAYKIDEDENVTYFINFEDVKIGLDKAANGDCAFSREAFHKFATESLEFDLTYADALMQEIVFGEVIYG